MPSLITHLAIAKRYTELHPNKISILNDFYKGSIAPDLDKNFSRILSKPEKAITHYYLGPNEYKTNFDIFKHNKRVNFANDYWKGYYAHLLADDLFYNFYFEQEVNQSIKDNTNLYDDFTALTSKIIEDYHPELDDNYITNAVQQTLIIKDVKCKYLDYTRVHDFIEEISKNLDHSIQNML